MLAGAAVAAATLLGATIAIHLEGRQAVVVATYRFAGVPDSVTFLSIRLPGQHASLHAGDDSGASEGGTRLKRAPDAGGTVTIQYTVTGSLDRIPIPVPTVPTSSRNVVAIAVTGVGPSGDHFPRLVGQADSLRSQLSNVPSLVQITSGRRSPLRWLDGSIVMLLAAATLLWLRRRTS